MVKGSYRECKLLAVEFGSTHSMNLCADCFSHRHCICITHPISNEEIIKSTLKEADGRLKVMENAKILLDEGDIGMLLCWRHKVEQMKQIFMRGDDVIRNQEERYSVQTESIRLLRDILSSQTYFNFLRRWFDSDQPGDAAQKEIEMLIEIEAEKKFSEQMKSIYQSIMIKQKSEFGKLKSEISFLKNKLSESNDQIDALKGDLLNARECIDDHENFVNLQKEEIIKLLEAVKNLESENFDLKAKVKETNLLNGESNFIKEEIKIDRDKDINDNEQYKKDIDSLVRTQPILDKINLISIYPDGEEVSHTFDIVLIGESMSRKTALIYFLTHRSPGNLHITTVGIEKSSFKLITSSGTFTLNVFDTGRCNKYFNFSPRIMRGMDVVFLMYTATSFLTFEALDYGVEKLKEGKIDRSKTLLYLVGVCPRKGNVREVTREQVEGLAKKYEFDGEFEVDVINGQYVNEVFAKAAEDLVERHKNGLINHKIENELSKKKDKKNKWYKIF